MSNARFIGILSSSGDPLWYALILLVGGLVAFGWGLRCYLRRRLILQTPTSRVRSAALGRVELQGKVPERVDLISPICGVPCSYFRYRVEEEHRNKKGQARWSTLAKGTSSECFYLQDDTDFMLIDPTGAEVDIPEDYRQTYDGWLSGASANLHEFMIAQGLQNRGGRLRFTEWRLEAHDPLFVFGTLVEREDLAERSLVPHENLMVRGEGRYYLISDASQEEELTRLLWRTIGGVCGGAIASVGGLWMLLVRLGLL